MELSDDAKKWLDTLKDARANKSSWEALEKHCRQELINFAGEFEDEWTGEVNGQPAMSLKKSTSKRFNMAEFKKWWPKLYVENCEETQTLTLKTVTEEVEAE